MSRQRHITASAASAADGLAAALIGFAFGVCVNAAAPQLRLLLWLVSGH